MVLMTPRNSANLRKVSAGALWVPEMLKKDKKLSQIKSGDWQSYKKRSWLFIPPFF